MELKVYERGFQRDYVRRGGHYNEKRQEKKARVRESQFGKEGEYLQIKRK